MNQDLFSMDLDVPDSEILSANRLQKKIKRALDVVVSVPAFVITLPLVAAACLAIRLESPGSPIYRQARAGRNGSQFTAYKLRTMYEHSSDGNLAAPGDGDARVTRVGRILRKTSIDELPQLVNVIKGEMSILGPRAVPGRELELRIESMLARHPDKKTFLERAMHVRMLSKPGISGMAQAYGRSSLTAEEATGYDVYYTMNYSLGLDLEIFAKTVQAVLFQKGAN